MDRASEKKKRIVVAMSGGVDSSTVAALLVEAGHEVIGLSMKTHKTAPTGNRACCTPDDMRDARRVADMLGIACYVMDYAEVFKKEIIEPFVAAYRSGQTPNPCVACNDKIKFKPMLARARLLGADALATGHYARLFTSGDAVQLWRGRDPQKDQSYFLYRLQQSQLQMLQFPLGDMTKQQVRQHARRLGLDVADKQESQEICFVGAQGYAQMVESEAGVMQQGEIVDQKGQAIGRHHGIHHFTIGQRRGLRLATSEPHYVTHIDASSHRVTAGPRQELLTEQATLVQAAWVAGAPKVGQLIDVQQRYRGTSEKAHVIAMNPEGTRVNVRFSAPVMRAAPGQAIVIYDGDRVVGGGTLAAATSAECDAKNVFNNMGVAPG